MGKVDKELLKQEYIRKSRLKFGKNKFDYSLVKYVDKKHKVSLKCNDCGSVFKQTPDAHFVSKFGCPTCAKVYRAEKETKVFTENFLTKAKEVHGNRYKYDKVKYTNNSTKIEIKCTVHNKYFKQQPHNHLQGNGCPECGREKTTQYHRETALSSGWAYATWEEAGTKSKNFDSFKLYIIECVGEDGEHFTKVGKTFLSIGKRFKPSAIPYDWKLIKQVEGSAGYISKLEEELHRNLKNSGYSYMPKKLFCGAYECYKATYIEAEVE